MSSEYVVDVREVDKTFQTHHFFEKSEETGRRRFHRKQPVHAADHVSFAIRRGEVFGLLGPNGAGKTTTVKMLCGLVKPDSGDVYIDGLHVERKRLKVLEKVGVVLEGTRTSIWPLTPLENLAYYGNLKNVRGSVLKKRSRELVEFVGLKEKMNVQVRKMSRGQKQKLALCIALIADPEVILLDEPTTGLDVQSSRSIKDRIIEMTRKQDKCVLVTTHDMHVAQEICDRIGIIDKGRLITCKPTQELIRVFSDQVYEFWLDQAPAEDVLARLPGVHSALAEWRDGAAVVTVTVEPEPALRSAALYAVIEALRARGVRLQSITQRKQTLENVFLRLTSGETLAGAGKEG